MNRMTDRQEFEQRAAALPPLLKLHDIDVAPARGADPILRGISLGVRPGECVGLVGPSGSGKTTLLRTISGMIPPSRGIITLEGTNLASNRQKLAGRIGMITQKHDLVDVLRVDKNVMAGALGRWSNLRAFRFLFWAKEDELAEAEAALEAVGLADKLKRPTSSLSGGEQQRVAIARALVQAPSLLLADEPVASLDKASAVLVLDLLTSLARERGTALIVSLHQVELANRYCDRIIELGSGRTSQYSPTRSELA